MEKSTKEHTRKSIPSSPATRQQGMNERTEYRVVPTSEFNAIDRVDTPMHTLASAPPPTRKLPVPEALADASLELLRSSSLLVWEDVRAGDRASCSVISKYARRFLGNATLPRTLLYIPGPTFVAQ